MYIYIYIYRKAEVYVVMSIPVGHIAKSTIGPASLL